MTALEHVSTTMPSLSLKINGEYRVFNPDDANNVTIKFNDGRNLILTVENTGMDNQVEDFMYRGRYQDTSGEFTPGGHTFGTKTQMTNALELIIASMAANGTTVLNGDRYVMAK